MKNTKIMSLVVCVLVLMACRFSQTTLEFEEVEKPKALFLYNFEYVDKKRIVRYIDEIGDVYTLDLSSEEIGLKLEEINEKLDSSNGKKTGI